MPADIPTLLLVEDDPVLRTFLADNLTADGYELVVSETVGDGLRELEYKRPDLAIVDVGLPDASGLEAYRCVNKRFFDWPDAAADAVRAFDLRDRCQP